MQAFMRGLRSERTGEAGIGRKIGALLAAFGLLTMTLTAPLHAVSHIGERLGSPARATAAIQTQLAGFSPAEHSEEGHGVACALCLLCFNGAFAAAPGGDAPPEIVPANFAFRIADPERMSAETGPPRRERPEVRGPPSARA
jgi:hypothetical protein